MTGLRVVAATEVRLSLRDPAAAFFSLVLPLVVLVVLMQVFGNTPDPDGTVFGGYGPTDFYVPGYLALTLAAVGLFALPVRLTSYDETGVLRRFAASGMTIGTLFAAEAAVALLIGVLGAALMLAVAVLGYDLEAPADAVGVAAAFLAVAVLFLGIGLLLGSALRTPRAAQAVGLVLFFLGLFLSGTGPPPELLGSGLGFVSDLLPLTYAVEVIQAPWLGEGWDWARLALCLGLGAACTLVAHRVIRWGAR